MCAHSTIQITLSNVTIIILEDISAVVAQQILQAWGG